MPVIPCPACGGDEVRKRSCQFCARKGYVPDGPGALLSSRKSLLKIAAVVVLALAVVYLMFLFPRDEEMDLLRKGLREKDSVAVKDIDILKGKDGEWAFGTVTTEDGERLPIAAKWSIDRTRDERDVWQVEWIVAKTPAAAEQIERLKSNR